MTLKFNRIDFLACCGEPVRERADLSFECDALDFLRLVLDFDPIDGAALPAEFSQRVAMLVFQFIESDLEALRRVCALATRRILIRITWILSHRSQSPCD